VEYINKIDAPAFLVTSTLAKFMFKSNERCPSLSHVGISDLHAGHHGA